MGAESTTMGVRKKPTRNGALHDKTYLTMYEVPEYHAVLSDREFEEAWDAVIVDTVVLHG